MATDGEKLAAVEASTGFMEGQIKDIFKILEKVRNRLPVWATMIIAGLSAMCSALLVALFT